MPVRRLSPRSAALLAASLAALAAAGCPGPRPAPTDTFDESLRRLLRAEPSPGFRSRLTTLFYERRGFRPAWLDAGGLRTEARSLLEALAEAEAEGLDPCDYGSDRAEALVFEADRASREPAALSPDRRAELDAVLTDSFLSVASHLAWGRSNPKTGLSGRGWPPEDEGLVPVLEQALDARAVRGALLGLAPRHGHYLGLRRALAGFREERAAVAAMLDPSGTGPGRESLVRRIALLDRRIETLRLNLERWRWLPRFLGRRFLLVDTAGFRLFLVDRGGVPMTMKVVVGSAAWPTPFLAADITGFIINPHWDCPPSIFFKETINYIRADKNYLPSNKMVVFLGWGTEAREVDPASLDWAAVSRATHPTIRLRQMPGPLNILGRLKFVMPNPEDIYLHDTPYQDDFRKPERTYSHGCIRAEKPFDLAAFLYGGSPWTKEAILAAVERLEEREVRYREPVPIYAGYFTAWPLENGGVEFRRDVYGRDAKLAASLGEPLR